MKWEKINKKYFVSALVIVGIVLIIGAIGTTNASMIEVSQPVKVTNSTYYERGESGVYDGTNYWVFYGVSDTVTGNYGNDNPDTHDYKIYYKKAATIDGLIGATAMLISGNNNTNIYLGETDATYFNDKIWVFGSSDIGNGCALYSWNTTDGIIWDEQNLSSVSGIGVLPDGAAHFAADACNGKLWVAYQLGNDWNAKYWDGDSWSSEYDITTGYGTAKFYTEEAEIYFVRAAGCIDLYWYNSTSDAWEQLDSITENGAYDPIIYKVDSNYVCAYAPWVSPKQWIKAKVGPSLDTLLSTGSNVNITAGMYGSNSWVDMWPYAVTDAGGNTYLFFTSERNPANPDSELTGNIWYLKVDWNVTHDHFDYIQPAIDTATVTTINVSAGTYKEYIHIIKDNITIQGAGINQTIIDLDGLIPYWHYNGSHSYASRGGILITPYGQTAAGGNMPGGDPELIENVMLKGFTVRNAGVNSPGGEPEYYDEDGDGVEDVRGVLVGSGKNIIIKNCKVENSGDFGISFGRARLTDGGTRPPSENPIIRNCIVSNNHDTGINVGSAIGNVTIVENMVSNNLNPSAPENHAKGICVAGKGNSLLLGGLIANNTVTGNRYYGIEAYRYTDGIIIENNTVTGHNLHYDAAGIFVSTGWGFSKICRNHIVKNNIVTGNIRGLIAYYTWNCTFENNTVSTDSGTYESGQATIKIDHGYNMVIRNNIVSCDGPGIELTGGDTYNCLVTNNAVDGAMFAGIYIRSGAHNNTFVYNEIRNTASDTFTQYADWGNHDGGDNQSILIDTTKSWTPDAFVGMIVINEDDGSSGIITANTATTIIAMLSGGTENDWDAGDAYDIVYNETRADGIYLRGGNIYSGGESGTGNVFHYNTIYGNADYGLENQLTTSVDAEYNYWGDASGPYHANGNWGDGDNVSDSVDYCPWLDAPYPGGSAVGRVQNLDTGEYFCAIQDAIDFANPGDTLSVSAGLYCESVTINKSINLLGQPGALIKCPAILEDLRIQESSHTYEYVIGIFGGAYSAGNDTYYGAGTINVNVSDFTIDSNSTTPSDRFAAIFFRNVIGCISGCIVQNTNVDGKETFGILGYGAGNNVTIFGNTVNQFGRGGIGLGVDGYGLIKNNTVIGPGKNPVVTWAPNGIQVGYGSAGFVIGNDVSACGWNGSSWSGTGILIVDTNISSVVVDNNYVHNCESGITCAAFWDYCSEAVITNNTIEDTDWSIGVHNDVRSSVIRYNTVVNCTGDCVDIWNYSWFVGVPTNVEIHYNKFMDAVYDGLWLGSYVTDVVNATYNYWGDASGPYNPSSNPDGQGVSVSDNVYFDPWLGKAINDSMITDEDVAVYINVTANDIDGVIDISTVTATQVPAHGSVEIYTDGVVKYTPDEDWYGVDVFRYKVKDIYGTFSNEATVTITVNSVNEVPVVDFTYSPLDPNAGGIVYFNSTSYDPDGTIVNWTWDFGDGNVSYGEFVTHQYTSNGSYSVTLQVEDDYGNYAMTGKLVLVGGGLHITDLLRNWNFISLPFNKSVNKTDIIVKYNGYYYSWTQATTNVNPTETPLISPYIFGWNRVAQTYTFADTLNPGYGYWLYSYQPCELWMENTTLGYDEYITDVAEKWNIISIPFNQSINKTDILVEYLGTDYTWSDAVDMGVISNYLFGWDRPSQMYGFADVLEPGYCYWMYAYHPCRLKRVGV